MSRLVAFGCSNTFGLGLKDSKHIKDGPSDYAWPKLLADKYNLECVNNAVVAASNKEIWAKVLGTNLRPSDIVLIHWTYVDRWCTFDHNQSVAKRFYPSDQIDRTTHAYYKHIYNDFDNIIDLYLRADQIHHRLKSIGVNACLQGFTNRDSIKIRPSWCSAEFFDVDIHQYIGKYKKAADNLHPGELAHRMFTEDLYFNLIGKIKND